MTLERELFLQGVKDKVELYRERLGRIFQGSAPNPVMMAMAATELMVRRQALERDFLRNCSTEELHAIVGLYGEDLGAEKAKGSSDTKS